MQDTPILFIKAGCPWCNEALAFFSQKGVALDIRDVNQSSEDRNRLKEISGQTKTPTMEFGDFIVADFDVDEFQAAVNKRPDIKQKLGL